MNASEAQAAAGLMAQQRRFLVRLSELEKSQVPIRVLCSRIEFTRDAVSLQSKPSGEGIALALGSDHGAIHDALERLLTVRLAPRSALAEEYPVELDLAGCWAELHWDLGRTSYLDELDATLRYESIRLMEGSALVSVTGASMSGVVAVEVPLDAGSAPLHVADEIGEALRAAG